MAVGISMLLMIIHSQEESKCVTETENNPPKNRNDISDE